MHRSPIIVTQCVFLLQVLADGDVENKRHDSVCGEQGTRHGTGVPDNKGWMGQHEKGEGHSRMCKDMVARDCRQQPGGAAWFTVTASGGFM